MWLDVYYILVEIRFGKRDYLRLILVVERSKKYHIQFFGYVNNDSDTKVIGNILSEFNINMVI